MSKKHRAKNTQPKSMQSLSDTDIDRLTTAITSAILEAERAKACKTHEESNQCSAKKVTLFQVLFVRLKKLKIQNGAISLVKLTISWLCLIMKWLGYIIAIWLIIKAIYEIITMQTVVAKIYCLISMPFVIAIWLLSRFLGATSIEIEESENPDFVFGISSYFLAIIAIIITFVK